MRCGTLYLPGLRAFLCPAAKRLHAEQTLRQEVNVGDWPAQSTQIPGFVSAGLYYNVTSDDWEGVLPAEPREQDGCPLGPQAHVLLTSAFLPDLLCFPGFEDCVVCIHCILIWQERDIKCPQQLWRSEKQGGGRKGEFYHLREFTNGTENDSRK